MTRQPKSEIFNSAATPKTSLQIAENNIDCAFCGFQKRPIEVDIYLGVRKIQ